MGGRKYLIILTSLSYCFPPSIAFGVMKMYCRLTERRAVSI